MGNESYSRHNERMVLVMADLSKITLPSGSQYNFKDAQARADIEAIQSALAGGIVFIGTTTTALTDGCTTNPITINSKSVTAVAGNLVRYQSAEFLFDGTAWAEMGDISSLGALAFKDSASGSFTPSGSVSQPTFTGQSSALSISVSADTSGNYQPAGTVSKPSFTGSSMTSTGVFTPSGSVSVSTNATTNKTATVSKASSGTATYTPEGTVSAPTFTGTATTSSGKFTPAGSVSLSNENKTATVSKASSGTATYTPEGSVAAPTISVKTAGSTTTIKNPTKVTVAKTVVAAAPGATAPANAITYYAVSGETLSLYQLGYTTGDSITTSNVTVKNGDAAYEATAPAFTGTGARLVTGNISVPTSASFTGTEGDVSVSGTPGGSVSAPTFTGTGARLVTGNIPVPSSYTASFTGDEGNVSVSGTTTGSVSQPTFTGTKVQISGTTTAAGTVSKPTFTGTADTVTVS